MRQADERRLLDSAGAAVLEIHRRDDGAAALSGSAPAAGKRHPPARTTWPAWTLPLQMGVRVERATMPAATARASPTSSRTRRKSSRAARAAGAQAARGHLQTVAGRRSMKAGRAGCSTPTAWRPRALSPAGSAERRCRLRRAHPPGHDTRKSSPRAAATSRRRDALRRGDAARIPRRRLGAPARTRCASSSKAAGR